MQINFNGAATEGLPVRKQKMRNFKPPFVTINVVFIYLSILYGFIYVLMAFTHNYKSVSSACQGGFLINLSIK